jgi:hypothetical protein
VDLEDAERGAIAAAEAARRTDSWHGSGEAFNLVSRSGPSMGKPAYPFPDTSSIRRNS